MTIQTINTGSSANAGNGDTLRSAFSKINSNFTYINSSLTNLILSGGLIGPTGPQGDVGPPGPQGDPGIGGGEVTFGQGGRFAIYFENGTSIASTNSLSFNTTTNTLLFGNAINTSSNIFHTRQVYSSNFGDGVTFSQHHETPDVTNFTFYRTRGTSDTPLPLRTNDDVADIAFISVNNLNTYSGLAQITVQVENSSTFWPSGKIKFFINDGTSQFGRLGSELNSSGTWKVDFLDSLTTGTSLQVKNNLIPGTNLAYDLGSTSSQWRSLYVGNDIKFSDNTTQTTAFAFIDTLPATSTSTGIKGQLAVDSTSLYVCVATNSWLKFSGVTF